MRIPNSVYGITMTIGVATLAFLGLPTSAVAQPAQDTTGLPELQIDVKHLPKSCLIKTQRGDKLSMHYDGALANGTPFDSSRKRGQPFDFTIGNGQVIKGWGMAPSLLLSSDLTDLFSWGGQKEQGLLNMCPGEQRTLTIPPHLGYGDRGAGGAIPGGATLVFEVELLDIKNRKAGKDEL